VDSGAERPHARAGGAVIAGITRRVGPGAPGPVVDAATSTDAAPSHRGGIEAGLTPPAVTAPRAASAPPEARGLRRDEVALLVSSADGHRHASFLDLPGHLRRGDLLVVNDSATLPAALPANGAVGDVALHLSTRVGADLWLAEPRWSSERPGPLPLEAGDRLDVGGVEARLVAPYPRQPRLWFVRVDAPTAMARVGSPIRYAYVSGRYPLRSYQSVFAAVPGSAEMPSAGRPFSTRVLAHLHQAGVLVVSVTLHTGVSSLEHDAGELEHLAMPPEPFFVPRFTARAVHHTRAHGGRVVAVGTTVVRALESAVDGERVRAGGGFTRRVVHPRRRPRVVDGLLTGFHEPRSSHLALLSALAGDAAIRDAYRVAAGGPYLWHEFGDVHLLLPERDDGGAR